MKWYWRLLSLTGVIVLILMVSGIALAATWAYKFPTKITDTSSTARTYYPVITGMAGQDFIDGGFTVNGTDTNMQYASTNAKYMLSTDEITTVVSSLPANGSVTHDFYTGYAPVQTGFYIIPGDGGYITTSDDATIELGGDGSIAWTNAYLNTSTAGNLADKTDAINIATGSGNVTATIYATATTATYRPSAAGDETNITAVTGAATHWEAVNDQNDATYVSTASGAYQRDLYNIPNHSPSLHGTINSITFNYRIEAGGGGTAYGKPSLKTGGTAYDGTEQTQGGSWADKSQVYATNPDTSSAWTWDEVDALQIGVSLKTGGAGTALCSEVWIVVNYTPDASVSQTVAAGEHDLTVGMNTPFLWMATDAVTPTGPVAQNLVMNAPLGQVEEYAAPGGTFTTIDSSGWTTTVTGAVWAPDTGYNYNSGAGDVLTILDDPTTDITATGFTVIAILRPDDIGVSRNILSKRQAAANRWEFYRRNDNMYRFVIQDGAGANEAASAANTNITSLLFAGATVTIGGNIQMYINGVASGSPVATTKTISPAANLFIGNGGYGGWDGDIAYFAIYSTPLTADQMLQCYNALMGSDISTYSTLATVADDGNDYTLNEDDAVVYCSSLEFTVASVQALYYGPTVMLTGATLPDDSVNSNDGTITWGTNQNISIAYGAMVPYSSTDFNPSSQSSMTVPTQAMPSQWFASGSNIAALPFYNEVVLPASTATGIAAQTFYVIFIAGLSFIVAAIIGGLTQSGLIFLIVADSILMVGASMTIIPMWIPFAVIVAGAGLVFLRRQLA